MCEHPVQLCAGKALSEGAVLRTVHFAVCGRRVSGLDVGLCLFFLNKEKYPQLAGKVNCSRGHL